MLLTDYDLRIIASVSYWYQKTNNKNIRLVEFLLSKK